jgi:hypothetical protein
VPPPFHTHTGAGVAQDVLRGVLAPPGGRRATPGFLDGATVDGSYARDDFPTNNFFTGLVPQGLGTGNAPENTNSAVAVPIRDDWTEFGWAVGPFGCQLKVLTDITTTGLVTQSFQLDKASDGTCVSVAPRPRASRSPARHSQTARWGLRRATTSRQAPTSPRRPAAVW